MKNTPGKRWLVIASPQGHLGPRPAGYFRRFPNSHQAKWQRLTRVRLPPGVAFDGVKNSVHGWAIMTYGL